MSYKKIYKNGKPVKKEDRKDGKLKYKYKIRCYSVSGREINRHVLAVNDREAALIEGELTSGTVAGDTRWSVAVETFCRDYSATRTKDYLAEVRRSVRLFIDSKGDLLTEDTDASIMSAYLNSMSSTPRQANLHRSIFLSVAGHLKRKLLINSVPFENVPKVEYNPDRRLPFHPDELKAHYLALGEYARPIFRFIALSGCRVTAACGVREGDIDGDILTLYEKGMRGQKKERKLKLDKLLLEVLDSARELKASKGVTSEYLFINSRGNPWVVTALDHNVQKAWAKQGLIIKDLGRPHILHELRHGYGTLAGKLNFNPDVIAASLGHSSRHTSEIYVHHDSDMAYEAGQVIRPMIAETLKDVV